MRVAAVLLFVTLVACGRKPEAGAPGADRLRIAVDRRVELFSVLWRLGAAPEYNQARRNAYLDAVDTHFAPFRDHEAVRAVRELRATLGIVHEQPLSLAIALDDSFRPATSLSPLPDGVGAGWQRARIDAFLEQVRDFAAKSGFDSFMREQAPYTAKVEARFRTFLADKPVLAWFDALFGRREGATYLLAPGLLVGPWSYGISLLDPVGDGRLAVVQVMSLEAPDAEGLPRLGEMTHGLLAHELGHPYVNRILEANLDAYREAAEPVFRGAEARMRAQHYPTLSIVVNESVVRALAALYLRDRNEDLGRRALLAEEGLGFAWTSDMIAALDAARKRHGGRISDAELVAAVRAAFTAYSARQR